MSKQNLLLIVVLLVDIIGIWVCASHFDWKMIISQMVRSVDRSVNVDHDSFSWYNLPTIPPSWVIHTYEFNLKTHFIVFWCFMTNEMLIILNKCASNGHLYL